LATPRRSTTVKILEHLTALADIATQHQNNRASGTAGYDSSADYVADQLAALGYEVTRQTVDFTFFREAAPVSLTVGDETWTGIEWLHALLYAPSGDVEGRLQPVGIVNGTPTETSACDPNDWDEFTSGRIALVFGGVCRRRDVVELAQSFGAAALISMYPPWGANQTRQPTLFDPAGLDIPAIAVGREPSDALLAAVESGVDVRLSVEVEMTPATADNVIGEIDGNSDAVIMLGGHLDSVLDGPGINDNGSGVAALLSIAESVAAQPQPEKTVRFGFWAAEEPGTFGSGHYVDGLPAADREQIEAYINLDLVGSLHAVRHVYADTFAAPGSDEITRLLLDAFADAGTPALGVPSGGSDHIPFMEAGIPTGGLFSGIAPLTEADVPYAYFAEGYHVEIGTPADACYHLACDDLQNVDFGWAPGFVRAAAAALEALAY
jgi:aminopeptidase Y